MTLNSKLWMKTWELTPRSDAAPSSCQLCVSKVVWRPGGLLPSALTMPDVSTSLVNGSPLAQTQSLSRPLPCPVSSKLSLNSRLLWNVPPPAPSPNLLPHTLCPPTTTKLEPSVKLPHGPIANSRTQRWFKSMDSWVSLTVIVEYERQELKTPYEQHISLLKPLHLY